MITVTIQGAREITALFTRAPEVAKKILRETIKKGAYLIENISAKEAPHDSGNLGKSVQTDLSKLGEFRAEIAPVSEYAIMVHEGHGEIRPKNKKVLAVLASRLTPRGRAKFSGRINSKGYIIIGKRVKAVKANRFMDRGVVKSESAVKELFDKAEEQIIASLTTK